VKWQIRRWKVRALGCGLEDDEKIVVGTADGMVELHSVTDAFFHPERQSDFLRLPFFGRKGTDYQLEKCGALGHWTVLTNFAATGDPFVLNVAPSEAQGFFRATVSQP
jgi:hypothetical protein